MPEVLLPLSDDDSLRPPPDADGERLTEGDRERMEEKRGGQRDSLLETETLLEELPASLPDGLPGEGGRKRAAVFASLHATTCVLLAAAGAEIKQGDDGQSLPPRSVQGSETEARPRTPRPRPPQVEMEASAAGIASAEAAAAAPRPPRPRTPVARPRVSAGAPCFCGIYAMLLSLTGQPARHGRRVSDVSGAKGGRGGKTGKEEP